MVVPTALNTNQYLPHLARSISKQLRISCGCESDAATNLPIAVCLRDEAEPLIDGHFCLMDASSEGFTKAISIEEANGRL